MQRNPEQRGIHLVHSDDAPVAESKGRKFLARLGGAELAEFAKRNLDIRPALSALTFSALAIAAAVLISYRPDLIGDELAMKFLRLGLILAGMWQFVVAGWFSLSVPILGIAGGYAGLEALKAGIDIPVDPHAFQFAIITSCVAIIVRIVKGNI